LEAELDELEDELVGARPPDLSLSLNFERLVARADSVAGSAVPVILAGPSGSGKEVLARRIHERSGRRGAFLGVNCGALAPNLVESTLFGHKKGSFSGASSDHPGLFRSADGGTLLLDELAELPADAQVKLLRALQEREVTPVGADHPVPVDVRIIAASHRDLAECVRVGQLRQDLHMRLWGLELELPALVSRLEDLGLLCAALAERHWPQAPRMSRECWRALYRYSWPGNVRELEQVVITAIELAGPEAEVKLEHLPARLRELGGEVGDDDRLEARLRALLAAHRGNVSAVARELGKARVQVRRWCKRFGIEIDGFR
ncbi:MAG: sigma 54-interacting transcriptional regulator, partial [Deltaproteobacteria bacterium]|nr:sigma 54-interacting transcriptional regulator [Deltaproteobacteria bacterium]